MEGAGGGAPEGNAHLGEVDAVRRHGLPVDLTAGGGPVLIGGDIDAGLRPAEAAEILEPPVRPGEVRSLQGIHRHALQHGDGLPLIGNGIGVPRLQAGIGDRVFLGGLLLDDLCAAEIGDDTAERHVPQQHRAADTGGDDEIPVDLHVMQDHAVPGADHGGAGHILAVLPALLPEAGDQVAEDVHHLRPGDGLVGPEQPALPHVVEPAVFQHGDKVALGVVGHVPGVVKGDVPLGLPQGEGPGDHGHRLLAGDVVVDEGLAVVAEIDPGGVELQDGALPVVPGGIGEGVRRRLHLVAEEAVQDAGEGPPSDGGVRAEAAVVIAPEDAVLPAPAVDGTLGPVARRVRVGGGGRPGQSRRAEERRGQSFSLAECHDLLLSPEGCRSGSREKTPAQQVPAVRVLFHGSKVFLPRQ